jgi:hypothetical protein
VREKNGSRFVAIFAPQDPQCAHLYADEKTKNSDFPLCLHPGKKSWKSEEYWKILPAIIEMKIQGNTKRKPADRWIRCRVDWDALAICLDLSRPR